MNTFILISLEDLLTGQTGWNSMNAAHILIIHSNKRGAIQ